MGCGRDLYGVQAFQSAGKLGSIDPNDACLVVDSLQDVKQVVYPVTGSGYWKMGWIDTYVPEPVLSGISLAAAPNKTSYYVGETLDTTGLLLTASFSDSSEKQISDGFTCDPTLLETPGTQSINVTYEGFSTVFFVEVLEPVAYDPSISLKYPTVSFEGAFLINFYFAPGDTAEGTMQLYYWTSDVCNSVAVLNVENCSGTLPMANEDGTFNGIIDDIAAKDLNRAVYVAGIYTDAAGESHATGVLGYSIGVYCAGQASDEMQGPLSRATAVYGHYADAYFNS